MASDNSNHHDQDLLLAKVLQEQERAFHALLGSIAPTYANKQGREQSVSAEGLSDEELARQLQEQEDEEFYAEGQEHGFDFDADVDYDRLSYEEFNALGDVVGAVSKGLDPQALQQLPRLAASQHLQQRCSCNAQQQEQGGSLPAQAASPGKAKDCTCAAASTMCVVCQCEFEGSEVLKLLPACGHVYHEECINQWLSGSKDCPICHKEVTPSQVDTTVTKE